MRTAVLIKVTPDGSVSTEYYENAQQAKDDFKLLLKAGASSELAKAEVWTSSSGRIKRKLWKPVSSVSDTQSVTEEATPDTPEEAEESKPTEPETKKSKRGRNR